MDEHDGTGERSGGASESSRWRFHPDAYTEYGDKDPNLWYTPDEFDLSAFDDFLNVGFTDKSTCIPPHPNADADTSASAASSYQVASTSAATPSSFDLAAPPNTSRPWQKIAEAPPLMKPVGRAGDKSLHVSANGQQLSTKERKVIALERNRSAALRSRTRKKMWLSELESKVEVLKAEQVELKLERSALQERIVKLKEQILELKEELLKSRGQY